MFGILFNILGNNYEKRIWTLLMVVAAFTLVLAGCGAKENTSSSDGASSDDSGKKVYKVGTEATFAPLNQ